MNDTLPSSSPAPVESVVIQGGGKKLKLSDIASLENVLWGAFMLLLVTFATLVISYFSQSSAAFNNLSNQITTQNAEINNLIIEIQLKNNLPPEVIHQQ